MLKTYRHTNTYFFIATEYFFWPVLYMTIYISAVNLSIGFTKPFLPFLTMSLHHPHMPSETTTVLLNRSMSDLSEIFITYIFLVLQTFRLHNQYILRNIL